MKPKSEFAAVFLIPDFQKIILMVFLVLVSKLISAQLSDAAFNKLIETKDLVILNEDTRIVISAKKAYLIEIMVEQEIEYKILTTAGNDRINPVVLPAPFDEVYQPHNSTIRSESRLIDELHIFSFSAAIVEPNGDLTELEYDFTTEEHRVVTWEDRFGRLYSHSYALRELLPGETVRIKYVYSFPFRTNWQKTLSTRVFLETDLPREYYTLTLSHHESLEMDLYFANSATPEEILSDNHKFYRWKYTNQPGCIKEPGSRPHLEMPWFTFTPKPYEFIYQHFNSFIEEFVPFWYFLSYDREAKIRRAYINDNIGSKDRDNLNYERLARRYVNMLPNDTICSARLKYFQRFVVDSVRYDDAFPLFNRMEGNRKLSPGTDLYSGFIREPNKEVIYAGMIPKFGCSYLTGYLDDVRSGYISAEYFAPVYDNEMLFAAITNNNQFVFVMPKSDKRNLYCEELPFYYENAPVLLISTFDFAGYKRNFYDQLSIVVTPGSQAKDNSRRMNSLVKVNLNSRKLSFNTRLSLSGQYSTLVYPVYNDGQVDNTINPKYLSKIWDISDDPKVDFVKPGGKQFYFPFNSSVNAGYSTTGQISTENGIVNLNIGRWIKHVYYENFDTTYRFTNFFADFAGSDTFAYMLEFDQPVSVVELPENIDIENDFGVFKFAVQQTDENKILINSYFLHKLIEVKKEDIHRVAEIYHAIESLNQATLMLRAD
jgi:hypothetical protein